MTPERAKELWLRLLGGEPLDRDEESELMKVLEADPQLRNHLLEDAELDGSLRGWGQGRRSEESFSRSLDYRMSAADENSRFIRKLEGRLNSESGGSPAPGEPTARSRRRSTGRASGDPGQSYRLAGLVAASLLFGAALFLALGPSEPDPANSERAKAARASREAERRARVESQRRQAEAHLQEIERRSQALSRQPERDASAEEKRRKALEELRRDRERIERELREAIELARKMEAPAVTPQQPREETPAVPQEPPKEPIAPQATATMVASVERVAGDVFIVGPEGKVPARASQGVPAGRAVETGAKGLVVLKYGDGTLLELGPETVVRDLKEEGGKRLTIAQGTIRAEVSRQPARQEMVFATPHGEAVVLGTTLRLSVDLGAAKGTRLDVEEGKVRLRDLAGKTVEVPSGHYAVAAGGAELVARPFPVDEIVLVAARGTIVRGWRVAPVSDTSTGRALVDLSEEMFPPLPSASLATFTFHADADREYFLWVRGRSLRANNIYKDMLTLEIPGSQIQQVPGSLQPPGGIVPGRFLIDGFAHRSGFWWVGGDANRKLDDVPVRVRFDRTGPQTLRVYGVEPPMAVDVIWFSVSQKTRPQDAQHGPKKKP